MGSNNSPQIQPVQVPGASGLSGDILSKATSYLDTYGGGGAPNQSVVGFNPYQTNTMGQLQQALGQPNPLTSASSSYVSDVLNGKYLNPATNPSLAASGAAVSSGAQRFLNQNLDQIGSNFGLAGGASSSAMANAKKSAVTSTAGNVSQALAGMYGGAYNQERGNQQNVLGAAQSLSQAPVQQLEQALSLGGTQQSLAQAQANLPLQNFLTQMGVSGQGLQAALQALQGYSSSFMMPQYAPSQLSQNLGMVFGGMNAAGNLAKGFSGGR